jgi:hypothetical protein
MPHDPADWLTTFENFEIVWRSFTADICTFENERHVFDFKRPRASMR